MAFSDPRQIVRELSLRENMRVADFGTGSGHYALAAARAVGGEGRVYAVDIQKNLLSRLKNDAVREGVTMIEVVWGDIDERGGSRLRDASVDVVILANVLYQTEHRKVAIEEAARVLKPKGKILFVEWLDSFQGLGPQKKDIITSDFARELFQEAGFQFEKEIQEAGDHHYGLIFTKA